MLSNINADWSLVTTVTKDLSKTKIVNLGRKFDSTALIIRVDTREKKDTWYYGGKIWVSSLVLGQQAKFYQTDLDLFEQELIVIPKYFSDKYSLLYEAPKYFKNVTLKVWQYNKPIEDANNLDEIVELFKLQQLALKEVQTTVTSIENNQLEPIDTSQISTDVVLNVSKILNQSASQINSQLDLLIQVINSSLPNDRQIEQSNNTANNNNFDDELV